MLYLKIILAFVFGFSFLTTPLFATADDDHHAAEAWKPVVWEKMTQEQQNAYHGLNAAEKAEFKKAVEDVVKQCQDAKSAACEKSQLDFISKKFTKETSQWDQNKVKDDLKAFVARQKTEQGFVVKDELKNVMRHLELEKVHTEKILRTPDGTYFVCADFNDQNGDKVDVDFFMTPSQSGSLEDVQRVKVHKVNDKARYTYVLKNDVWVEKSLP